MASFTLYGSPHSLPTYKVALMLRLSQQPFSFRYVSFQKGIHKTPEFKALSRWGQVPVLLEGERVFFQSAAIVEHLADTLGQFQGHDMATRQAVREWMYWDVDALYPPIWNCYGVQLGQKKLLPIGVDPIIADYHLRRAETALSSTPILLTAITSAAVRSQSLTFSATPTSPLPRSASSISSNGAIWLHGEPVSPDSSGSRLPSICWECMTQRSSSCHHVATINRFWRE